MTKLIMLMAANMNNVIGCDGKIPWMNKEDLSMFKQITMNNYVICGRKTFESLPTKLPGRKIIVLSNQLTYKSDAPNVIVFYSIDSMLSYLRIKHIPIAYVIGGAQIFNQFNLIADSIWLSRIPNTEPGDTYFCPDNKIWYSSNDIAMQSFTVEQYSHKNIY